MHVHADLDTAKYTALKYDNKRKLKSRCEIGWTDGCLPVAPSVTGSMEKYSINWARGEVSQRSPIVPDTRTNLSYKTPLFVMQLTLLLGSKI